MTAAVRRSGSAAAPTHIRIDSLPRWFPDFGDRRHTRQLLALLCRRDVTVKYRQTVLGVIWVFISPLLAAGLFTFVFGNIAQLSSDGVPYFAFSYAGLLAWNVFSDTLTGASKSLGSNSALITKVYFPRFILPLAATTSALINLAISFVVLLVVLLAIGLGIPATILLLPIWLVLALALALGLGMMLTSIAVAYRDVNHLTSVVVPMLLYLTPVAYATSEVPEHLQTLYRLNPLVGIVEGCRFSVLGTADLPAWSIAYSAGFTLVSVIVGLIVFARLERNFADVV